MSRFSRKRSINKARRQIISAQVYFNGHLAIRVHPRRVCCWLHENTIKTQCKLIYLSSHPQPVGRRLSFQFISNIVYIFFNGFNVSPPKLLKPEKFLSVSSLPLWKSSETSLDFDEAITMCNSLQCWKDVDGHTLERRIGVVWSQIQS